MTIRPRDLATANHIKSALDRFESEKEGLLGISDHNARDVLVAQIIESLRRIEYVHRIRDGEIDPRRADPSSNLFDPIRAAAWRLRRGELDEAFWLIFYRPTLVKMATVLKNGV